MDTTPHIEVYKNNFRKDFDINAYISDLKAFCDKKTDSFSLNVNNVVVSQRRVTIPLELFDNNVDLDDIVTVFSRKKEVTVKIIDSTFFIYIDIASANAVDYSLYFWVFNIIFNLIFLFFRKNIF